MSASPGPLLERWVGERARELRREQTPQEQQLWTCLRAKRFAGHKFRRQTPIGRYIADFICLRARLIVELDGGQHQSQRAHDEVRDEWLRSQGFEVLRVWNSEWQEQPQAVLNAIWEALERRGRAVPPLPNPSPARGEGL